MSRRNRGNSSSAGTPATIDGDQTQPDGFDAGSDEPEAPALVPVDYRGTISNTDKGTIQHSRTPLIASIPEHGIMEWITQPGFNLVSREVVEAYAEHAGIKSRVDAGEIEIDYKIPTAQAAMLELVGRSYSRAGLEHLLEHETANYARPAVLKAIEKQLRLPRCEIEPKRYRSHVAPILKMERGATMGS
jgi:hypothetical protein